ncbi:NADH dehydrogenase (ubiquinone) B14.5 B subunit [Osmia lignaria lignaria]|uniref:NADH dehydrogenase (ubiquinone) B14.5 B subunit n=1 Tax=Osmia lignaria lignaria TaxID=1437193 RepID=UPI001478F05F|nr:NADH dehydrogenase [ubiquinone] 1 subunit C2 [Osmia lignaria]
MEDQEGNFPAQWALDLIRGPTNYKESLVTKYVTEVTSTLTGVGAMFVKNYLSNRPYYASIHWTIGLGILGFIGGRTLVNIMDLRYAKRDAMMVDYIKQHPERFPAPRNKKFAEIIEPWYPIR